MPSASCTNTNTECEGRLGPSPSLHQISTRRVTPDVRSASAERRATLLLEFTLFGYLYSLRIAHDKPTDIDLYTLTTELPSIDPNPITKLGI
jgi:hypothetical protein